MNKPFRVCLLPVLLFTPDPRKADERGDEKKRSAANEGLKM
jgi:hypothetical protein